MRTVTITTLCVVALGVPDDWNANNVMNFGHETSIAFSSPIRVAEQGIELQSVFIGEITDGDVAFEGEDSDDQ